RRVVELGRVVRRRGGAHVLRRSRRKLIPVEEQQVATRETVRVRLVRDDELRLRVVETVLDRVVAVQHGKREQDRTELPDAEKDGCRLGGRRQNDGDAIASLHAVSCEHVRSLVGKILQLAPVELAQRAVEALPDHRGLVARMLVAYVGGDVVPRRHLPTVSRADVLVPARARESRTPTNYLRGHQGPRSSRAAGSRGRPRAGG